MTKTDTLYLILAAIFLCSCGSGTNEEKQEETIIEISEPTDDNQQVIDNPKPTVEKDTIRPISVEVSTDVTTNQELGEIEVEEAEGSVELTEKANTDLKELPKKIEPEEDSNEQDVKGIDINALPDHNVWNNLTKKYVTPDGDVNYKGLRTNKEAIEKYISKLTVEGPKENWSHNVRLAYWINLYNAVTVNLILDNYPLKSIMDINGGTAWDLKLVNLAGDDLSLNDIEHNIIRKRFDEPRIHFAVNCAAKSCPKLLNEAFFPEALERQLEKQANYFIHNTGKNHISDEQLELSSIFDWYGGDFGDVKAFVSKYESSINSELIISFLEYDWSLNELK